MELTPDHKPVLARHRDADSKGARAAAGRQTDLFNNGVQMNIIDTMLGEIIQQLQNLDINQVTPIDALNILAELKKKTGNIPE
jgi:cell division protein ZapA (FtsZ GTPase activity inhibitor)